MNKAELIDALAGRLGDRKSATAALDAVLAEIQNAVTKGDKVAITGFGVFEKRVRAARTARNPRTGESVKVKKTSVPAFRAGASFKDMVAAGRAPRDHRRQEAAPARKKATNGQRRPKATKKAAPARAALSARRSAPSAIEAPPRLQAGRRGCAPAPPGRSSRGRRLACRHEGHHPRLPLGVSNEDSARRVSADNMGAMSPRWLQTTVHGWVAANSLEPLGGRGWVGGLIKGGVHLDGQPDLGGQGLETVDASPW